MTGRNITDQIIYIDAGENYSIQGVQSIDHVEVQPYKLFTIPPERMIHAKDSLKGLINNKLVSVISEDQYDTYVWREVSGVWDFVPRALDPGVHLAIDDGSTSATSVWSSNKTNTEVQAVATEAVGGDLSGNLPNPSVIKLNGDALPTNVADGFVKRNTANDAWEEVSYGSSADTITQGGDSRIPTQDENDALVGTSGAPSSSNKYITELDSRVSASYSVQTLNATPVTIASIPTVDNEARLIMAKVRAEINGTALSIATYVRRFTVKQASTVVSIVNTQDDLTYEDVAGWDVTALINGTSIDIQVTGDTSTIDWTAHIEVI